MVMVVFLIMRDKVMIDSNQDQDQDQDQVQTKNHQINLMVITSQS